MKKELTETDLINMWMVPYHGITIEKAYEQDPWEDSATFYKRYAVTQQQHDDWNEKALEVFRKHFGMRKTMAKRHWGFTYLNVSPSVKGKADDLKSE